MAGRCAPSSFRELHRVHGLRCGLPAARCVAVCVRAKPRSGAGTALVPACTWVGGCRLRSRLHFLRIDSACQGHEPLADEHTQRRLHGSGAPCKPGHPLWNLETCPTSCRITASLFAIFSLTAVPCLRAGSEKCPHCLRRAGLNTQNPSRQSVPAESPAPN